MKFTFGIAVLLISAFLQDWFVQKIDTRVSVSFPSKPTRELLQGEPYYSLFSTDGFNCVAMASDYAKVKMDSAAVAQYMSTAEALTSTEESLLKDFKGSALISGKSITYGGHITFDITMTTGQKTSAGQHDILDYRMIVVGPKVYSLYFYYDKVKPLPAIKDKFYNSFVVK